MAEKIISPGDSIERAAQGLRAGDVLTLRPGAYHQAVRLDGLHGTRDAPIVIRGEKGAVIDGRAGKGGKNAGLPSGDLVKMNPNTGIGGNVASLFLHFNSRYLILRNITFKGSMGRNLSNFDGQNVVIENCTFLESRTHGIVNTRMKKITIRNCLMLDSGGFWKAPRAGGGSSDQSALLGFRDCHGIMVEHNTIGPAWGEVVIFDTGNGGSSGAVFRYNRINAGYRAAFYCHGSSAAKIYGNVIAANQGREQYGRNFNGLIIQPGEPKADGSNHQSNDIEIHDNAIIGPWDVALQFRGGPNQDSIGNVRAHHNTIAGAKQAVVFKPNNVHGPLSFTDNVVHGNKMLTVENEGGRVAVRNNAWSKQPAPAGQGDIVGVRLNNPDVVPEVDKPVNLSNYELTANSPGQGVGADFEILDGGEPVDPPPEPEPGEPMEAILKYPDSVEVGETITLDGSESTGDPTFFNWRVAHMDDLEHDAEVINTNTATDFFMAETAIAEYTPEKPGFYAVQLTVKNGGYNRKFVSLAFEAVGEIEPPPPPPPGDKIIEVEDGDVLHIEMDGKRIITLTI